MPDTPNELFRAARLRSSSRIRPDTRLSQRELAELVSDWVRRHYHIEIHADADYVSRLERGLFRWPRDHTRAAFRAVLNVPDDDALGFYRAGAPVVDTDSVKRQEFLAMLAAGLGGLATAWQTGLPVTVQPAVTAARVGRTEIDLIRNMAAVLTAHDFKAGGGSVRDAVTAQLRWSLGLLRAQCPQPLRAELLSAVGLLAHTCGFAAFDLELSGEAAAGFRLAVACAQEARDWHLYAKAQSSSARQEIWFGHPDDGLMLAEQGLAAASRLTATERAMLHLARARALAKMHRVEETLRAVGAADDAFAERDPGSESPWMAYYDHAQHDGDVGHALYDLAVPLDVTATGQCAQEAARRLSQAVQGHARDAVRSRTISGIKWTSLVLATRGDLDQAASLGAAALDEAQSLRSARALRDLRHLNGIAVPYTRVDGIAELRHRISDRLRSA